MIIDSHVHVWDLSLPGYTWPDASIPALHRTLTVDDVAPLLDEHGISGAVLVQAADTLVDTDFMLAQARQHARVVGVVAWVDLGAPSDAVAQRIADLRQHDVVVGVRSLIHLRDDPNWIMAPGPQASLRQVADAGLPFDYVTSSFDGITNLLRTLDNVPNLKVVIDHLGKPPIGGTSRQRSRWLELIAGAAEHPQTSAKLSGLYSSVGELAAWEEEQVRPFVEDALELFGPERLMSGGDWPVSQLAGGYNRTWTALTAHLAAHSRSTRAAVLGETAQRIYSLPAARLSHAQSNDSAKVPDPSPV